MAPYYQEKKESCCVFSNNKLRYIGKVIIQKLEYSKKLEAVQMNGPDITDYINRFFYSSLEPFNMSTLLFGLDSINDHKLQSFPFVFQWPDSALKSEVGDRIQSVTILAENP